MSRAHARRRAPLAAAVFALALLLGPPAAGAAVPRPSLSGADSAIVVDAGTGEVLLSERPDQRRPIASTTKMMTALVTSERAKPDDVFPAADYDAEAVESQIGLRRGERLRVLDLLRALLLESANDAAVTLAENVAGSRTAFVALMNRRAGELGLRNTRFANPIGLDDPDNFSSARDLTTLARRLLADRRLARIVDLPSARLRSGARPRAVANRNRLVRSQPFVTGVKTGRTSRAGYVLVGSASGRGASVVSAVLGEPSEPARDADSLALLRFGLDQFRRVRVVRPGRALARARIRYRDEETVALAAARPAAVTLRRGERAGTRVRVPEELEGPLPAGRRVGTVQVVRRGRVVSSVPVVTARAVPEAGVLRRVASVLGTALTLVLVLAMVLAVAMMLLRRQARRAGRRREAAPRT